MIHKSKMLSIASILSLIQSLIWIPASIAAILVYLCEIEIRPYKENSDFFRVTLVKLYFEGTKCKLNGSYLGQFESEYRNPDKISLLTPDIVFAVMAAYIILHFFQFFLSISVYKYNENGKKNNLLYAVLNWSFVTLCISAFDLFLTVEFFWDMLKLIDYINQTPDKNDTIKGIEYVPLILSIASSRLIVFWLYNVFTAMSFFLCGACCQKVLGIQFLKKFQTHISHFQNLLQFCLYLSKKDKFVKEKVVLPPEPSSPPVKQDSSKSEVYTIPSSSPSDINKVVGRITSFDTHCGLTRRKDWDIYSKKTVTYFNDYSGKLPQGKGEQSRNSIDNKEVVWNPSQKLYQYKDDSIKEKLEEEPEIILNMVNEGFVNDEPININDKKDKDFAHRFENFDQGRKKVKKTQKPPIGKFVPPPVPPSPPDNNSCNC